MGDFGYKLEKALDGYLEKASENNNRIFDRLNSSLRPLYHKAISTKDALSEAASRVPGALHDTAEDISDVVEGLWYLAKNPRTWPIALALLTYGCSTNNPDSAYRQRLENEAIKPMIENTGRKFDRSKIQYINKWEDENGNLSSAFEYPGTKDSVISFRYDDTDYIQAFTDWYVPEDPNKPIKPVLE